MKAPTLEAGEVERFRAIVRDRIGLSFDDRRLDFLAEVLRERMAAHGDQRAGHYFPRLLSGAGSPDDVGALAERLTVGETFFFRNAEQLEVLVAVALPERLRAVARRPLNILSAGCSSGEEALSLAMAIDARLPEHATEVSILGVDINPAALHKARSSRYSEWSLRQTPPAMRERYFRRVGRDLVVDDAVRARVQFLERNLVDDAPDLWRPGSWDIVFCRNVTMYFPAEVTRAVLARVTRALVPGGYLFLGHAENLRELGRDFHLRHTHDTFYYQRTAPEEREEAARATEQAKAAPRPQLEPGVSWTEAIARSSQRIAEHASHAARAEPERAAKTTPAATLALAMELLQRERFHEALALLLALPVPGTHDAEAQLLRAVLLTNSGQWAAARATCVELLAGDELNAGARYLMALLCEHAGNFDGAVEQDRVAIYLDPLFAMPHLHLGLLARRVRDARGAQAELEQALALLEREEPARILLFGGGFGRGALIDLCRAELRAAGGRA